MVTAPDRPLGQRALSLAGAGAGAAETLVAVRDPDDGRLLVTASSEAAVVRAAHVVVRQVRLGARLEDVAVVETTRNRIRMLDHWDNLDGSVERGYAGRSISFAGGRLTRDWKRIDDYGRLLASVGVNAVCVNNVVNTYFLRKSGIPDERGRAVAP